MTTTAGEADATEEFLTSETPQQEPYVPAMHQAVRLLALHELALDAGLAHSTSELGERIVEAALRISEGESASVYLWDSGEGLLRAVAHGGEATPPPPERVQPGQGITGTVWQLGSPLMVDVFDGGDASGRTGLRATLGAPLEAGTQKLGVVIVRRYAPGAAFSAEDTRLLSLLAAQAGHLLARRSAEEGVRASEARFRALVDRSSDIILVLDPIGTITFLSPAAERSIGYPAERLLGSSIFETIAREDAERLHSALDEVSATPGHQRTVEYRQQSGDGAWRYIEAILRNSLDDAHVDGIIVTARDITARKQAEELLQHQALHDALTGLPNRILLQDRLQHAIRLAYRQRSPLALLFLDLDQFKEVNDRFGHHAGDQLLQQAAPRLQSALRDSDTLARLGGDEFAVVLPGARNPEAEIVAQKIVRAFEQPFVIDGRHLTMHVSTGIALFPDHGADAETLVRHADLAMYAAKRSGSDTARFGEPQAAEDPNRLALLSELRRALAQRWLLLHYQPVVELPSGRIVRAEALARWQHPERGLLMPDQFIPLAEQAGLIAPLTRWVLATALRQCRAWRLEGLELGVTVNLSPKLGYNSLLSDTLTTLLSHLEVDPGWLTFGITDSGVAEDLRRAVAMLQQLDAAGVRLSVEGFGSSQFTQPHLAQLGVDEIKIDRATVGRMVEDPPAHAVVRSVIELAHNAGLVVVAEGVENQETWDALVALGCDAAQGFFVGRPMPAGMLAARMHEQLRTHREQGTGNREQGA
ncbi:MAG TPA: EAL domain-containing protein [Dehalococcoidia bacterium]|nr:EAL domain-containing protein [Dehalococcoidia bacterium]